VSPLDDKALECLNWWPRGTAGWRNTAALLSALNALGQAHCYERIAQVATWMGQLWRDPEQAGAFESWRREHFREMGWTEEVGPH
jgi:hypothetical protein